MLSKKMSRYAVSVLGFVFVMSLCIGLPGAIAEEESNPCEGLPSFGCDDDCEFTTDFRLEDCKFMDKGINPFFILKPGYQLVLESEDEKSVETVLCDTKWINLDGRGIKTRVVEERAYELEGDEEKLMESPETTLQSAKRPTRFTTLGKRLVTARMALKRMINVQE